MKTTTINFPLLATAAAIALATLAACGGGGGDAAPLPPAPTPTPEVKAGNLLMTPQASPYPAGSAEKRTFDEFNRLRIGGGFGAAKHDAMMDKAAKAHVSYWLINPMVVGTDFHSETPGNPGFSGVMPWDRCTTADAGNSDPMGSLTCSEGGYMAGHPIAESDVPGEYMFATGHLQNALNYRYNRAGSNFQIHPAGPSFDRDTTIATMVVGYRANDRATLASDKAKSIVGVYPFDGMTGVGIGSATVIGGVTTLGYGLSILGVWAAETRVVTNNAS